MALKGRSRAAHDLPPLLISVCALVLILAVLPSALNLPQTDPAETLEYAPVPPEDSAETPPAGNVSSLGLGSSPGIRATPSSTTVPGGGPSGLGARGRNPSTKRCVGTPPRQTEDPLSPPCVAHFTGDNGGSTYTGVEPEEVRVLFYLEPVGIPTATSRGAEEATYASYDDLGQPEKENEFIWSRMLRIWQRYFNERFQTYGRTVHFYVYYATGRRNGATPEERRTDAAMNFRDIKPFAVVVGVSNFADAYIDAISRRKVMVFLGYDPFNGTIGQRREYFQKYPGMLWSYDPTVESRAAVYASWVCRQLVGRPASFSGPEFMGRPRKFGLLYVEDQSVYTQFGKEVQARVNGCGGNIAVVRTHTDRICGSQCGDHGIAQANIAAFQQAGVTTILWAGGHSQNHPRMATAVGYFPEWAVGGDATHELTPRASAHDQAQWVNAWAVTAITRRPQHNQRYCFQAAREADPDANSEDMRIAGCGFYPYVRQLFTGIQVAGPRLGPRSMDKGFHAIPRIPSSHPEVPACFYDPGDYSCVKDGMAEYWDPDGRDPDAVSERGCWRMPEGGRRYLAGTWPERDPTTLKSANDVCNAQIQ